MLPLLLVLVSDPLGEPRNLQALNLSQYIAGLDREPFGSRTQCPRDGSMRADATPSDRIGRSAASGSPPLPEATPALTDNLMFRETDPLRRYLLLDRRVGGCSASISFPVRRRVE